MGVLWNKLWYDIWKNKGRSLQVILIIAIGAAALGMIISVRSLVIPAMQTGWQAINPAMITMAVSKEIDDDTITAIKNTDGIIEAEGYINTTIEWRINPGDEWKQGGLIARANYPNQKLTKIELVNGNWPHDKTLAIEQGHAAVLGIPNNQVYIKINDKEQLVQFDGEVYNQFLQPIQFGGSAQFYITRDRYEELTGKRDFNVFFATAAKFDKEVVTGYADAIEDKLKKQGIEAFTAGPERISNPNKHFFQDSLDGLFFMLGVMGLLALILGLLLVYNTINAVISQQVDQIGIMKAIGANTRQILFFYLVNILIFGILALLLAVPLSMVGGWGITSWLVGSFNADAGGFSVSSLATMVTATICIVAPLLASLVPILGGARITVREAISTYGLSTGVSLLDRLMVKTRFLSRMAMLTLSNTFRNKWRVVLLQITLVLSGLIFMMIISVRDSVVYTFSDVLMSILNYDVNFVFDDAERISYVEKVSREHPDVKAVEMWGFANMTARPRGQKATDDDKNGLIFGVPLPTQLYGPQMRQGRWLLPEDTYAVVLNQEIAKDIGVVVGDWITLKQSNDKESNWQVVGLLADPLFTTSIHAPRETLLKELNSVDRASTVWIQTGNPDHAAVAKTLREYYKSRQIKVSAQRGIFGISDTSAETAQSIINQFNFIVVLMGIMAIIIGAVGSIALSGALSLSVIERTREIGVMRAVGASSGDIIRLFVGEGLILGWISWLIAMPLAPYSGKFMLQALGSAFQLDLVFKYTPLGALMWLGIITVLSVLASWFPAQGATRISVRQSLAYQ